MFNYITIDKTSKTPLYEQIKNSILLAIENGALKEGDKLPTEQEICNTLKVSRIVAKQAYSELLMAGQIERKRSKGTFVKKIDNRGVCMYNLLSFEQEMKLLQKTPSSKLIETIIVDTDELNEKQYIKNSQQCCVIKRLRYADNDIFNLTVNIIPLNKFKNIEKYDFANKSLYQVLEQDYYTKPYKAHRCISAQIANDELAHYLEIETNAPLIVLKSIVYDENNEIIEISYEYMEGNSHHFEYDVSL